MYKTMEADEDKQPHQGDVDGVSMLNLDAVPGRTQAGKHQKWKVAPTPRWCGSPRSVRRGGCLWPFAGCQMQLVHFDFDKF